MAVGRWSGAACAGVPIAERESMTTDERREAALHRRRRGPLRDAALGLAALATIVVAAWGTNGLFILAALILLWRER